MADTNKTQLPALTDPPTSIAMPVRNSLVQILQALRTLVGYSGNKLDAAVTWRDLANTNGNAIRIITSAIMGGSNGSGGSGTAPTIDTPTAPANVKASGAISLIFVSWDRPTYSGHSYAEVWAAAELSANVGDFGNKTMIGMTTGGMYADAVSPQTTRYYWVRHVNTNGDKGPFSAVAGAKGVSQLDPSYVIPMLAHQITTSQLSTDLGAEIDGHGTAITSLSSRYTVKIDANGYVAGFGLASDSNNGTPYSSFMVRADCFSIASPSGPGVTPAVPFIVRTTATTINGQAVPAGVYLKDGFIQNGTINNLAFDRASGNKIQILDADIVTLSVSKLLAGSLSIGQYVQSSNYVAGASGWILRADGSAELGSAYIRGQLTVGQINYAGSAIDNGQVKVTSDGKLTGGGGGQVTWAGMGGGALGKIDQITSANSVTYIGPGSLAANQLTSDLNGRINLIDAPASTAGSVAAQIAAEAAARGTAVTTEQSARQSADTNLAQQITTITAAGTGAFDAASQWNFDTDGNAEGWFAEGGCTLSVSGGWLRVTSSNGDPYFGCSVSIIGSRYSLVRARVKRVAGSGWDGTCFYSNANHGESGSYNKNIAMPSALLTVGGIAVIEWDMSGITDWTSSTTTFIRLDLGSTSSDVFDIDWIAVGRNAPGASVAALQLEQSARQSADSANAQSINTLAARLTGSGDIATAIASAQTTANAAVSTGNANATNITAVSARLDSGDIHTSIASVTTTATAAANQANGTAAALASTWQLVVDASGKAASMKAYSTGQTSGLVFSADKVLFGDLTNIVGSSMGDSTDGWAGNVAALDWGASSYWIQVVGIQSRYALTFRSRDAIYGNPIYVKAGESYYFSMDTVPNGAGASTYSFGIGFVAYDNQNNVAGWWLTAIRPAGTYGYSHIAGNMTIPAGAAYVRIWVQIDCAGGENLTGVVGAEMHATNIVCRHMNGSELIVDGGVKANNIASGAVTADKMSAWQMLVGQFISSSNYVAGSSGWTIRADGSAELQNVKVRGDIEATTIKSGSVIVATENVFGNAITNVVANSAAAVTTGITTAGSAVGASASLVTTGASVLVQFWASVDYVTWISGNGGTVTLQLLRDGGLVDSFVRGVAALTASNAWFVWSKPIVDSPSAGAHTYSVRIVTSLDIAMNWKLTSSITLMEVKR